MTSFLRNSRVFSPLLLVSVGLPAFLLTGCGDKPKPTAQPAVSAPQPNVTAQSAQAQVPGQPPKISTLAAYYHFDEAAGSQAAADVTGKKPGRLNAGVTAGSPGLLGHAVYFSRASAGQIAVGTPLDLQTNTVTMLGWVRRRGGQQPNTALVYARGSETVAGVMVGSAGELGYAWGREGRTEGWPSGLTLPDGEWAFVALVVEPNHATLYLGVPGSTLKSATNSVVHAPAEFNGALTIGRDPLLGGAFEGSLDELGIWKNALSRAEVEKLFTASRDLAAKQAVSAQGIASSKPAALGTDGKWNDAEFTRAVALMTDAQQAYKTFVKTRQNPPVLKKIEDNLHGCVDTLEKCKSRAPAGVDIQGYIDRCNKLIFDVHATKTLSM